MSTDGRPARGAQPSTAGRTLIAALDAAAAQIGRTDARVLAGHALGESRAWLAANPMRVLSDAQSARFGSLVARRAAGQPVAYLIGAREFYGREFQVGPAVLIPRPETEALVEAALARLDDGAAVLDLGTGCGAIAVTLSCERPDARVAATDLSADALALARANAERLGAAVEFARGSWFAPVAGRRFDMVVANPPYVASRDPHLEQGDLRFEPRGALTDGSEDGLASIRHIVGDAPRHLQPGGWLLIEHGYDQAEACRALLQAAGFAGVRAIADLAGTPRVAVGRHG